MNTRTDTRLRRRTNYGAILTAYWLSAAAALTICASASARPEPQSPPPAGAPGDDPMSGPRIRDNAPPGRSFGEPSNNKGERKFAQRTPPHGMFIRAVRQLASDNAPEDLRLSPETADQIRAIEQEFQQQVKAFRDEHADEIKALREKAGMPDKAQRRGDDNADRPANKRPKPDRPDAPDGEARGPRPQKGERNGGGDLEQFAQLRNDPRFKELQPQLKALMDQAPSPEDTQAKQWALLTEQQQSFIKDHLGKARDNMRERMDPASRTAGEGKKARRGPDKINGEGERRPPKQAKPGRRPPPPPAEEMNPDVE